ncbi:MAG: hypothetical protein P4M04_10160 [Acidobacteriota bacterium]|nr:hypothetical protein [Acidobacteriota bacterium]
MKASRKYGSPAQLSLFDTPGDCPRPPEVEPRPEMVCFRGQTLSLVRHFFELSCQVGRLPSLPGREFFRARVSHHAIPSFEEQVVFVRNMQLGLERLSEEHAEMITLVGLYDLSREEVAEMLHCSRSWVYDHFACALDALSEIFPQARLLDEKHPDRRQREVSRQNLPPEVVAGGMKPRPAVESAVAREGDLAPVDAA